MRTQADRIIDTLRAMTDAGFAAKNFDATEESE